MNFRVWFLVAVLLVPVGPLGAQEEFPIGAWFPGMTEGDDEDQWAARLDSVKAAGFNTIHAIRGRGEIRASEYNKKGMALAHARGLKVQLHSWRQPPAWRSSSRNYWTRTFEAEGTDLFDHLIGREADA